MNSEKYFEIKNNILYKFDDEGARSVVVPDGITDISYRAFDCMEDLRTIELPQSVKKICNCAFEGCFSLSEINIPEGVTFIGVSAFALCENLKELTIPESVTDIGHNAFDRCFDLKLYINGNPTIGKNAFRYVRQVIAPEIPFSVFETTDDRVAATNGFLNNMSLYKNGAIADEYKKYILKSKKKYLPAIFEYDDVAVLSIFGEYKKINAKNFEEEFLVPAQKCKAKNCVSYLLDWKNKNISQEETEKEIKRKIEKDPYNVTDMKKIWSFKSTLDGTYSLTDYKGKETIVVVPERIGEFAVTAIDERCFSPYKKGIRNSDIRSNITEITLPDTIMTIKKEAFFWCEKLEIINIPEGVTLIGDTAFYKCLRLKNITLPSSITRIYPRTFEYCYNLTIHAASGSYAERYAKINKIPFVAEEQK